MAKVTGYTDLPQGDEKALQGALASKGPVSIAIDASHMSFQSYKGGTCTTVWISFFKKIYIISVCFARNCYDWLSGKKDVIS